MPSRAISRFWRSRLLSLLRFAVPYVLLGAMGPAMAGSFFAHLADPFDTETETASGPEVPWRATEPLPKVPEPRLGSAAGISGPLSLAQITDLALMNNPQTREAWAVARAQAAELGIARALYWPQLNGLANLTRSRPLSSAGASVPEQTRYGPSLSLAYVLFDFGAREGEVEAARYRLLSSNLQQNRVLQDVVLLVEQTYYQVLGLERLVSANQGALKSANASLSAANIRRQAGLATIGDVYRAETAVGQARLTVQRTEGELSKARGQLAVALGLPVRTRVSLLPWPVQPPVEKVAESLDLILDQAKSMRPDLVAAEAEVRAARAGVQTAKAAGLPTLELAVNGGRTGFFEEERIASNNYSIAVNLRIPLFTGFRDTYSVRLAEAQTEQAEAARDRLHRQSSLEVWQAYYDLNTAMTGIDTSSGVLRSATQSSEVALARYRSGVGSLLDLLTAQSDEATAQVQWIQSQFDWYTALARLTHARGALLPSS
ncbi:MAG: TolC family protein [Pseudomonadota bacterium]|nr:TolC family protein [Pseudomonadota bacterium]